MYTQTYKNTPSTHSQTDPGKHSCLLGASTQAHGIRADVQTGPHRHSFLEVACLLRGTGLPGHHGLQESRSAWPGLDLMDAVQGSGECWTLEDLYLPQPLLPSVSTNSSSRKPSLIMPFLSALGEEAARVGDAPWIPPQSFPWTPSHILYKGRAAPAESQLRAFRIKIPSSPSPSPALPPNHGSNVRSE